ncbi:thioredoxin domain-containing protein [Bdellovibrio sp. NC01]|uniref:thioredoxin domain-containing protein n=1 Tax=Bdellovibrio sp. NC01 TaxID=2220073 RepID=UPI0011571949|nr:thioredoxin domain-containing protein [Bdellovibrio sp. NC01]
MKTILISLIFAAFSFTAFARLSDGKAHLKLQGTKIIGNIDKGFHFNKDAPASLAIGDKSVEPTKKEAQEIIFDASSAKGQAFKLSFYVCDDKNTVCESHEETYVIKADKLVAAVNAADKVQAAVPVVAKPAALKKNKHGFYENNLAEALKLAAAQKKTVLVDFNAPWCPSCIRLETETFGEKAFIKASGKLIKVSVNIDRADNKIWADKYDVHAIPTMILMNGNGDELARLLDFRTADVLAKELTDLQSKKLASTAELTKKAEAGDKEARKTLATLSFNAMKYDEAAKWLAPLNENSLMLAVSEVNVAQEAFEKDAKTKDAYQKTLEKWIAVYSASPEVMDWRLQLAKALKGEQKTIPAEAKAIADKNLSEIQRLLATAAERKAFFANTLQGDYTGFERAELLAQLANTYEFLDVQDRLKATKDELATEVSAMKLSVARPGQLLTAFSYMKQAGQKEDVVKWLKQLIEANPKSDVYYTKLAGYYFREKDFEKALPYSEKAVELTSDLKLYNMKMLAEIQKGLNQQKQASETLNKALALPEAKLEANKKTVAAMEELKKSLVTQ